MINQLNHKDTYLTNKILLFVLLSLLYITQVRAQEEEAATPLTFSGSVDTYFRTNLNSTNDPENGDIAPGTSFANLPGFGLGMVNLIGAMEGEKVGFTADLVFGPRGDEAVFGSAPFNSAIVNQLYVYWNVSDNFTLTAGNFNTFLGYEVISPTGNFNYSTSYMFSYGPFSHTGLKAAIGLGSGFSLMLGVFNPTDATEFNPTGNFVGGAQLGYEGDNGGAWLNALIDPDYFQIDLTTGWDVSDNVYVGLNTTSASDNFFGLAGYFQVAASDDLKFGIRGEYFKDDGVGVLSLDESVVDITLSANYTVGNLTLIPEIRFDSFSEDDFIVTDFINGETANSLASFLVAAVYGF